MVIGLPFSLFWFWSDILKTWWISAVWMLMFDDIGASAR